MVLLVHVVVCLYSPARDGVGVCVFIAAACVSNIMWWCVCILLLVIVYTCIEYIHISSKIRVLRR